MFNIKIPFFEQIPLESVVFPSSLSFFPTNLISKVHRHWRVNFSFWYVFAQKCDILGGRLKWATEMFESPPILKSFSRPYGNPWAHFRITYAWSVQILEAHSV